MHVRALCMGFTVTLLQKRGGGSVRVLLLCCHLLAALSQSVSGEVRRFPEKHISPLPHLLLPHISHRAGEGSEKEHAVYFA